MGLDTFVLRVKDLENWDTDKNYDEAGYWRKCYGVDHALWLAASEVIEDQYSAVLDIEKVREFYEKTLSRADKIVSVCNRYKAFPYENVVSIYDLEDLDIDFDRPEMQQLWDTIDDISGQTFSDSIWGPIGTIRLTLDQLRKVLDNLEIGESLVLVSSF